GARELKTGLRKENPPICHKRGTNEREFNLKVIGTKVRYLPRRRFPDELKKVEVSDEVRAIADYYAKHARKIVEPNKQDLLNAAKNYIACRRIMAAEKSQCISMDCLGLVGQKKIPCPPCIAYTKLLDSDSVGTCECDLNAAISQLLTASLCGRPGFMQDPAPNTVKNTFMGAHCVCATRLDGFDAPPRPFILRSHSESDIGVSPQVLWRVGQRVTLMKFIGPERIILGTGRILANIDTPPSGGCRTSIELEVDDIPDIRDIKGFHQLIISGDFSQRFKAYAKLAGIAVEHI
ncbi:MAG: hypothetical protein J7M21_05770, partial [Planctomycetes bacterium]|nr:hypothetical protein [Planctomycetota bacterium]